MQLDIYFRAPNRVINYDPLYTAVGTLTPTYTLSNLRLNLLYMYSDGFYNEVSRIGWSASFRAQYWSQQPLAPLTAGSQYTLQIPSNYQSVSHLMLRIQRQADLTNMQLPLRAFQSSPELSTVTSWQVLFNSNTVFQEPLVGEDLLRELTLTHPEARASDVINSDSFLGVNSTSSASNLILVTRLAPMYPGDTGSLVSGVASASAVGSTIINFTLAANLTSTSIVNCWLTYLRHISIGPSRNGVPRDPMVSY